MAFEGVGTGSEKVFCKGSHSKYLGFVGSTHVSQLLISDIATRKQPQTIHKQMDMAVFQ